MTESIKFEWDPAKARSNKKKHGVSFELATEVFYDPLHLSMLDPDTDKEERWLTLGKANDNTVLVVHTFQDEEGESTVRIILREKPANANSNITN